MTIIEKLKNFRQQYDLSQHETAVLLKTTRGIVSNAEGGSRSMPENMRINLLVLLMNLEGKQKDEATISFASRSVVNPAPLPGLDARLRDIGFEKDGLQLKLQQQTTDHEKFSMQLIRLDELIAILPPASAELDLIRYKQRQLEKKILLCNEAAQLQLRVKISLLEAEANVLRAYNDDAESLSGPPTNNIFKQLKFKS